eukprot:scaffold37_cov116-Isochrysis_galbana.AAC.5
MKGPPSRSHALLPSPSFPRVTSAPLDVPTRRVAPEQRPPSRYLRPTLSPMRCARAPATRSRIGPPSPTRTKTNSTPRRTNSPRPLMSWQRCAAATTRAHPRRAACTVLDGFAGSRPAIGLGREPSVAWRPNA